MKRRVFLGLGAASIGAGALHSTGAFSSLSAGRGVSVSAADDPHGLLGISNVRTSDNPEFTNKSSLNMMVELTDDDSSSDITFFTSEDDDGSEHVEFPLSTETDESSSETVEIDSDGDSAEVKVVAELFEGGTLEDFSEDGTKRGEIELQRDFTPSPSEAVDFTGRAGSTGGRGDFEFDLINNSDIDIPLIGIGINTTTTDATGVVPVNRSDNNTFFTDDTVLISDTIIPIDDNDNPETDTRIDFDDDFTLRGEQTVTFTLDRFENDSGDNIDMQDENVRATFYFDDGDGDDSESFNLCNDEDNCGEWQ